jgi:hypothetical protein
MNKIEYDPFVTRQFSPSFSGTKVNIEVKEALLKVINSSYYIVSNNINNKYMQNVELLDSDWDFCKYLVIDNLYDIKCAVREITLDIYPYIRTDYAQRTPSELAILTRFAQLPPGFKGEKANYVVLVLYSREQLEKEFKPTDSVPEFYLDESVEWGIVSIMGTVKPYPDPIVPITIMRNSLGVDEGGNGEKLNRKTYEESVEFWSKHILVK